MFGWLRWLFGGERRRLKVEPPRLVSPLAPDVELPPVTPPEDKAEATAVADHMETVPLGMDPAGMARSEYDSALAEAAQLHKSGAISDEEYIDVTSAESALLVRRIGEIAQPTVGLEIGPSLSSEPAEALPNIENAEQWAIHHPVIAAEPQPVQTGSPVPAVIPPSPIRPTEPVCVQDAVTILQYRQRIVVGTAVGLTWISNAGPSTEFAFLPYQVNTLGSAVVSVNGTARRGPNAERRRWTGNYTFTLDNGRFSDAYDLETGEVIPDVVAWLNTLPDAAPDAQRLRLPGSAPARTKRLHRDILIHYRGGAAPQRRVTIQALGREPGDPRAVTHIIGWCHYRDGSRFFLVDRMSEMIDPATGEVVSDHIKWLTDLAKTAGGGG